MSLTILQLNFDLNVSVEEYSQLADQLAQTFADLPGLKWKIWILDADRKEAGGIYLFESEAAVEQYLNSPLAGEVKAHPGLKNLSVKNFGVMDGPTEVTRGPVS